MPYDPSPPAFKPYIPASARLPELTWRALIMGTVLGMVFGASSLYLVLKVGLTVSASIPVAVIAITLVGLAKKAGGREATILENSITQTAGSAGESLAFGLGVTMPAIMILGFDLEISRVMLVGVLGGLLGILMMIPMRRTMIVDQHRELKYPEGTACAEVLKAAATETSRAAAGEVRDAGSDEAREALAEFLRNAGKRGLRCVRVIHGKGLGSVNKEPVLKNKVRNWLVQKDEVIAFCQARAADGGAGALVVLLRAQA